jgi:exonuclease III
MYGLERLEEKMRILVDLENRRARSHNLHQILVGDFNIITTLVEKKWALGD